MSALGWWWVVVALAAVPVALMFVPSEKLLPLKVQIAVKLLGWQGFLNVVKENIATRALGTKTTQSREAWHTLVDTLRAFDSKYINPERGIVTEEDIAEAHLYGLHLLTSAVELFAHSDHLRPEFRFALSPWRKWWGDNPDVIYLHCLVHSNHTYVVKGRMGTESYFSLSVYDTQRPGQYATRAVSNLNDKEMIIEADGSFEVFFSLERPAHAKNWLRLDPGFQSIISRHYYEDVVPAALDFRRVNATIALLPEAVPTAPPTDASAAEKLTWIETFVRDHSFDRPPFDPASSPAWFSFTPNSIGKPSMHQQEHGTKTGGLGALDIAYSAGPWKLAPNEALIIEGVLPTCSFANVVLWNRYLQSLDYTHRPISLNRKQLKHVGPDGSYRIVLAHKNPGPSFNWLDTEGRAGGTIFFRFVLPTTPLAAPATRVVLFEDLHKL